MEHIVFMLIDSNSAQQHSYSHIYAPGCNRFARTAARPSTMLR